MPQLSAMLRDRLEFDAEPVQAVLPTGQFVFVNQAWRSLLQYSKPELGELSFLDLVPPPERERVQRVFETLLSQTQSCSLRTTLAARNGDWLRVKGRLMALQNEHGQPEIWMLLRPLLRVPASEVEATIAPEPSPSRSTQFVLQSSSQLLRLIMDHIPQAIFWKDQNLVYMGCNRKFSQDAGVTFPYEIAGKTDSVLPWAATEAGWYRNWDHQVITSGQPIFDLVEPQSRANGKLAWIKTSKIPLHNDQGEVIGVLGSYEDITEQKWAEENLEIKQRQLEALLDNIPHIAWLKDADGRFIDINEPFAQTFGITHENVIGKTDYDIMAPEIAERSSHNDQVVMQSGKRHCFEETIVNAKGQVCWMETIKTPIYDPQGRVMGSVGIALDITERKRTEAQLAAYQYRLEELVAARTGDLQREIAERRQIEQQLFQEKELAQITLHAIADGVITTDMVGRVEYLNPMAEKLTRWSSQDAKGQPIAQVFRVIDEVTRRPHPPVIERSLVEHKTIHYASHLVLVAQDGVEYDVDVSTAPIHDREGRIIGAVVVFRDVTHTRLISREIIWQANHDTLTGLINRFRFEEIVMEALQNASFDGQTAILCYLDLDQFKVVNDTCGHLAGDELLRQVSELLKKQLRPTDVLARLGGDEFGVLLSPCSIGEAEKIADRLREGIHKFRFFWQQNTFSIGVSIGLVALSEEGQTLASALSAADAACYAAKDGGRNRIHVYQANDVEVARQRRERQWSLRIQQSLSENRFCLYRQMIIPTLPTEEPQQTYYELLIRMIDEEGQLVSPGVFIPSAERYSLMPELDKWVINTFLQWDGTPTLTPQEQLQQGGQGDCLYMINLSGVSVSDPQFLTWVVERLRKSLDRAPSICFEITETAAITNFNQAHQFIKTIKQMGCRFALDDFGSGMSSFAYLKNLPVDFLKIDGKFVEDMVKESTVRAIVEAINSIGHAMGIETIAEYVNSDEIRQELQAIGVDYLQGYGIAMPEPFIRLNSSLKEPLVS